MALRKLTIVTFYGLQSKQAAAARLQRMNNFFGGRGWKVEVVAPSEATAKPRRGIRAKLARALHSFFTVKDLVKQAIATNADLYLVTSPPQLMLFCALGLTLFQRRPVIFEERDLLSLNELAKFPLLRSNFISKAFEGFVLSRCQGIVSVTTHIQNSVLHQWPALKKTAVTEVIPNGFLASEYQLSTNVVEPKSRGSQGPIRLIYSGNFYGSRNPMPLFEALLRIKERHPELDLGRLIELEFYGQFAEGAIENECLAYLDSMGLSQIFKNCGTVSRTEILQRLKEADVCLLVTHRTGSEYAMPAKFFEYLASTRPILAITSDPLVVEAIHRHRLGWVAAHHNVDNLASDLVWILTHPAEVRARATVGMEAKEFDSNVIFEALDQMFARLLSKN